MFTKFTSRKLTYILLGLIIIAAFLLRVFEIDSIPPAISWDEAAVGYNAYSIANFGKDEWGVSFPLAFKSFGDDKSPIHIYLTAISVKLLGLSVFSTRLPMVIFGTLDVIILFYLGRLWFNKEIGLIAAFLLAISPFNIQFSRFNHEAVIALFFFMLGLFLFSKAVKGQKSLLPFSTISFCISMLSYPSPKIVVPLIGILLLFLYWKDILKIKKQLLISILILGLFGLTVVLNPNILGLARAAQASIPDSYYQQTTWYQQTHSLLLGKIQLDLQRYLVEFSPQFLFISGDPIPRHSIQTVGEFYKIEAFFLIIGTVYIVYQIWRKKREAILLLAWMLLGPLPAAITGGPTEIAHAARSLFMMGSWNLVGAVGLFTVLNIVRMKQVKIIVLSLTLVILLASVKIYLKDYYKGEYVERYAIEWQYGMKQIADYIKKHPQYSEVHITDVRSQPYIFLLFYLQTPLPEYLSSVRYNETNTKGRNAVYAFSKYHFGDWNPIESNPETGVLYVVTSDQYDGLRFKNQFDTKKIVRYPNGTDAFYLVTKAY